MRIITARVRLNIPRVSGRYFFQVKCISWSYRNRGYDARTQRNKNTMNMAFTAIIHLARIGTSDAGLLPPRKISALRVFMNIIFLYSAMKNKANGPPAYSTLYPDTNSDSPSVRSNGARFVSAKVDTNHIILNGIRGTIDQQFSWRFIMSTKENDPTHSKTERRISPKLISYEIVWATARIPPSREYFDFEAHPDPSILYTARLDSPSIRSRDSLSFIKGCGMGIRAQSTNASTRNKKGEKKKRYGEAVDGFKVSFINSFKASANGCNRPYGPTTFGPFRNCIYPKTFRSTKVKKATASNIGTRNTKECIKNKM